MFYIVKVIKKIVQSLVINMKLSIQEASIKRNGKRFNNFLFIIQRWRIQSIVQNLFLFNLFWITFLQNLIQSNPFIFLDSKLVKLIEFVFSITIINFFYFLLFFFICYFRNKNFTVIFSLSPLLPPPLSLFALYIEKQERNVCINQCRNTFCSYITKSNTVKLIPRNSSIFFRLITDTRFPGNTVTVWCKLQSDDVIFAMQFVSLRVIHETSCISEWEVTRYSSTQETVPNSLPLTKSYY